MDGELDTIVPLVQSQAQAMGDVEALKEGIVAIFVTPSFLLINPEEGSAADRFATKLSYFLKSTTPDDRLRTTHQPGKLETFDEVSAEVAHNQLNQTDRGVSEESSHKRGCNWIESASWSLIRTCSRCLTASESQRGHD